MLQPKPIRLLVLLLLAGSAPGCSNKQSCAAGFVGSPDQAPQAMILIRDLKTQQYRLAQPGDPVLLEPPPQGGYVMYVGAQIKNVDGCEVEQKGILRDPDTGDEVGLDARTANLTVGSDGWGRPDLTTFSNVSNVNGCPDYTHKDVQGKTYQLEMVVTDREQRSMTVKLPIVPTCNLQNPLVQRDCICTCSADYVLGKCGFEDGGMGSD